MQSLVKRLGAADRRGDCTQSPLKYDGAGYPQGKIGEDIPLAGRIVAVADVFDALTSARPFKEAWDIERAREHFLAGRGTHFDSVCVDMFLGNWNELLDIRSIYQD